MNAEDAPAAKETKAQRSARLKVQREEAAAARKAAAAEEGPAEETRRVVLKRERVLVIPDDAVIDVAAIRGALSLPKGPALKPVDAWVPMAERVGASDTKAIESFAGKPGTPDAKQGVWKAIAMRAWKGGSVYKAPPVPLVEREAFED